jgi:ATP-dependent Clp protease protease subunit
MTDYEDQALLKRRKRTDQERFGDHLLFEQLEARRFFMDSEITSATASSFRSWTIAMERAGRESIELLISSPGGDVPSGLAMVATLRRLTRSGIEVVGVVQGDAASMAAIILEACPERVMSRYSRLMLHGISSWGGWLGDDLTDLDLRRQEVARLTDTVKEIITARTRGRHTRWEDPEFLDRVLTEKRPTWVSADEALAAGLVDEIVD